MSLWSKRVICKRGRFAFVLASIGLCHAAAADEKDISYDFDHVSCTEDPNQVRIVVSSVKKSVGLMVADLYAKDTQAFLKRRGRTTQVFFAAKAPVTSFCIHAPNTGEYAIAVYHDENANKALDKGAFGIPSEPWGISRNPKIRFSAPPIEKTLFSVSADQGAQVNIKLRKR